MCEVESLSPANLQPAQEDVRLELSCWCEESKSRHKMQPSVQQLHRALREDHLMMGTGLQGRCSSVPWEAEIPVPMEISASISSSSVLLWPGWLDPLYVLLHLSKETNRSLGRIY